MARRNEQHQSLILQRVWTFVSLLSVIAAALAFLFLSRGDSTDGEMNNGSRRRFMKKVDASVNDTFVPLMDITEYGTCDSIYVFADPLFLTRFFSIENPVTASLILFSATLYTIWMLAILNEDYFVPSVDTMIHVTKAREDVIGATVVSSLTSVPSTLISVLAVLFQEEGGDQVTTSIQSNLAAIVSTKLLVIGFCIAVSPRFKLRIQGFLVLRDSLFYVLSLVMLASVFADSKVHFVESIMLCATYGLYVCVCIFSEKLEKKCERVLALLGLQSLKVNHDEDDGQHGTFQAEALTVDESIAQQLQFVHVSETESLMVSGEEGDVPATLTTPTKRRVNVVVSPTSVKALVKDEVEMHTLNNDDKEDLEDVDSEEEDFGPLNGSAKGESKSARAMFVRKLPMFSLKFIVSIIELPSRMLFALTIPNSSSASLRRLHWPLTLGLSSAYLCYISYLMLKWTEKACCYLNLDAELVAFTLIPIGQTIPNIWSGISSARKSLGSLAISSVLGSNIFSVLMGFGVPWLLAFIIRQMSELPLVHADGVYWTTGFLMLLMVISFFEWKYQKFTLGFTDCLIHFGLFAVYAAVITFTQLM